MNSIGATTTVEDDTKLGLSGGIQFQFNPFNSQTVVIAPELFFLQGGNKEYLTLDGLGQSIIDRKVNLDYAGVYVPMEIRLIDETSSGLILAVGGFADYAVKGEFSDRFDAESTNAPIQFETIFDRLDLGYSIGLSFLSNGYSLKLAYVRGITGIEFYDNINTPDQTYLVENKGFTLSLGFNLYE